MIYKALEIAAKAHRNQNRKGTDIPYITHPAAVALMLCKAGCSEDVIATGILYDTIEDTTITIDFIRDRILKSSDCLFRSNRTLIPVHAEPPANT